MSNQSASQPLPPLPPIPESETLFCALIERLGERAENFRVSTEEVDDELLILFAQQIALILRELPGAVAARDEMEVRRHAHSLAGMGGTIGAPCISVVGEELSHTVKKRQWDKVEALLRQLQVWGAKLQPFLERGQLLNIGEA